ncbi:hypothetical protein BVI434_3810006 [Burkholderia vietnamiensis]|nr:hypothetical protein BVI434_3810006 [Burkholderia vietnamiensis]
MNWRSRLRIVPVPAGFAGRRRQGAAGRAAALGADPRGRAALISVTGRDGVSRDNPQQRFAKRAPRADCPVADAGSGRFSLGRRSAFRKLCGRAGSFSFEYLSVAFGRITTD